MSDTELLEGFTASPCDKCGGEVALNNDVIALLLLRTGNTRLGLAFSRHILPVVEDGEITCAGSPSRAQYLDGQPRDPRPAYPYDLDEETITRETYARLQKAAAALAGD